MANESKEYEPNAHRGFSTRATPNPLPYESPQTRLDRDPTIDVLDTTLLAVVSGVFVMAGVLLCSAVIYLAINYNDSQRRIDFVVGWAYFLAFAAVMRILFSYINHGNRRNLARWWGIGLLTGLGVGVLVTGLFFVAC